MIKTTKPHFSANFEQSTAQLQQLLTTKLSPLSPQATTPSQEPELHVVVTGAAGFLGVHLIAQLVSDRPGIQITALVRSRPTFEAQLVRYGLPTALLNRVRCVEGDLQTMPLDVFPEADIVVHSAARLHAWKSLTQLWADNVMVTHKLFQRYGARVVLISTLSVFVSSNLQGNHLPTEVPISDTYKLYGGYAQSKYLAEQMALSVGAPLIRLGLLTASTKSAKFPPNDFFGTILDALIGLGVYPKEYQEAWVDVTPVDEASYQLAEVVTQSLGLESFAPITHIANREALSLSEFIKALKLRPVSASEFFSLTEYLPSLTQMLLHFAFFKNEALLKYPRHYNVDLFQSTGHSYGVTKEFSVSNKILLQNYINFRKSGDTLILPKGC